jgi:hypothetical protein
MIVAGWRRMTVSLTGARWLAFCSSVDEPATPRSRAIRYIVFPECFVGHWNVGTGRGKTSSEGGQSGPRIKEKAMLYAMLAYHVEAEVASWTAEEDAALMTELLAVHDRLNIRKLLGPAARLGATADARTLRGPGAGTVIDGPFAETKEQLLGLYVLNCADEEEAIGIARDLRRVNPTAVYEIRPIRLYLPGESLPETAAEGG